jgi:hypothetical protein
VPQINKVGIVWTGFTFLRNRILCRAAVKMGMNLRVLKGAKKCLDCLCNCKVVKKVIIKDNYLYASLSLSVSVPKSHTVAYSSVGHKLNSLSIKIHGNAETVMKVSQHVTQCSNSLRVNINLLIALFAPFKLTSGMAST